MNSEVFLCKHCEYATNNVANFRKHENTHIQGKNNVSVRMRQCHLCPYSTRDSGNFSKHLAGKHKIGTEVKCSLCNFKTYVRATLSFHMRNVHKKQPKTTCDKCGVKLPSVLELRRHNWESLRTGMCSVDSKPVQKCRERPKRIIKSEATVVKKRFSIPTDSKSQYPMELFECTFCDKKFSSPNFLKKHTNFLHKSTMILRSRKTANKHDEPLCQSITETAYNEIILKHRKRVEESDNACKFCLVICATESALVNHLKRHRLESTEN